MSAEPPDAFPVEHEEHENHERYLITYADMITLLMALFIILFAIGQTDLAKYRRFAEGASAGGGAGILEGGPELVSDREVGAPVPAVAPAEELAASLRDHLGSVAGAQVAVEGGAVVVRLPSDGLRFASGSAVLPSAGEHVVGVLAAELAAGPGDILVEGHTDDRPTSGERTNWELSTDRAAAVVRALVGRGVDPRRLTAAGRADTEPLASNGDAEGRAANRRVEVVLLAPQDEEEPIQR
ncbi:MAG TPA: flagellar motor protein MotB [Acidimicrobiales bacterium]|nr:flagellar motor protein MotB [Acidimicrobiales bacterium]